MKKQNIKIKVKGAEVAFSSFPRCAWECIL